MTSATILSPLILTLSGIIGAGLLFVVVSSLVVFACIRGQRLRSDISLAPKKLDNSDEALTGNGNMVLANGSLCNGSLLVDGNGHVGGGGVAGAGLDGGGHFEKKMNTLNSLEKSLLMKNTIMKMTGSNQVLTTLANGTEMALGGAGAGGLPVYSEYEYNYSYPNELMMSSVGNNGTIVNNYSAYDNLSSLNVAPPPPPHPYSTLASEYRARMADNGTRLQQQQQQQHPYHNPISISIDDKVGVCSRFEGWLIKLIILCPPRPNKCRSTSHLSMRRPSMRT